MRPRKIVLLWSADAVAMSTVGLSLRTVSRVEVVPCETLDAVAREAKSLLRRVKAGELWPHRLGCVVVVRSQACTESQEERSALRGIYRRLPEELPLVELLSVHAGQRRPEPLCGEEKVLRCIDMLELRQTVKLLLQHKRGPRKAITEIERLEASEGMAA